MIITALIAARNEKPYLQQCLPYLFEQGVQAYVIDNDSTDGSWEYLRTLDDHPMLAGYERYPYPGYYDWAGMLQRKHQLRSELATDWVIHHDADELMQTDRPSESLADGIRRVAELGYTAIDFREFVFLPESEQADYRGQNYLTDMRYYYYHHTKPLELLRIFSNAIKASNVAYAGHRFDLDQVCVYPQYFTLRHYITLHRATFYRKYKQRVFAPDEVARGWHRNRLSLQTQRPPFPSLSMLEKVEPGAPLQMQRPFRINFWEQDHPDYYLWAQKQLFSPPRYAYAKKERQLHRRMRRWAQLPPQAWAQKQSPANGTGVSLITETDPAEKVDFLLQRMQQLPAFYNRVRALDFGCGTGRICRALAPHFERVDGVELVPALLEQARVMNPYPQRIGFHLLARPDFQRFEDDSFDLIYSNITLQHLPPALVFTFLSEFIRILRKGGMLFFQLPAGIRTHHEDGRRFWKGVLTKVMYSTGLHHLYIRNLSDNSPQLGMYVIPSAAVTCWLEQQGGYILTSAPDQSAGPLFLSYYYCVTK